MATLVTLTGTFRDAGQNLAPAGSNVTVRPTAPIHDNGVLIVSQLPYLITLVNGAIPAGTTLYATDDPTSSPTGVLYEFTVTIVGAKPYRFRAPLSYLVPTVDFADLVEPEPGPASYDYALASQVLGRIPYTEVAAGAPGRTLLADPDRTNGVRVGFQAAKGPDVTVIGTSIELGSGGDVTYNGVGGSLYLDGYPSNASYMLWACASSGGRLRMKRNAGIGGDTLGGIGHVIAPAALGATTLDVAVDTGPSTPYVGQTIFFDWGFSRGSLGPGQDANYVTAVTTIPGGVRLTLLAPTAVAHSVGDIYRHGLIGRFAYDVAYYGADIVVIGGPSNDGNHLTVAQAAAGTQILVGFVEDMGSLPVVSTMLPSSSFPDYIEQGNAALKAQCEDKGTWWFDPWRIVVDPATRGQLSKFSADTVHLNQEGAMAVAQGFHNDFTDRCEIRLGPRRRVAADSQAINCAPNGTFSSGSTGSGDSFAAAGYSTYTFFGAGFSPSIVPPKLTDTISGNLLQITSPGASVGGTWGQKATIPIAASGTKPAWHVGDRIFLEAFVRLSGFKTDGNCVATICLAVTGTGGSVLVPLFYHWVRDFEGTITNQISTIPSNVGTLTSIELQAFLTVQPAWPNGTGLGTIQVGELTLFNLTAGDV